MSILNIQNSTIKIKEFKFTFSVSFGGVRNSTPVRGNLSSERDIEIMDSEFSIVSLILRSNY